jgi:hypothetical protein
MWLGIHEEQQQIYYINRKRFMIPVPDSLDKKRRKEMPPFA